MVIRHTDAFWACIRTGATGPGGSGGSGDASAPSTGGNGTTNPGATTPASGGGTTTPTPGGTTATFPDPGTLSRPTSAVDVTTSAFTWRVRESFIRYINTEAAPKISGGATAGAAKLVAPATVPLVYDYGFTPAGGWFDAASGKARLLFKGKVTFAYPSHGIDFDVIDPEIELDGDGSRVIASFGGRQATRYSGRTVLVDLETAGVTPTVNGTTRSYASIAGTVPASASGAVFAGFYAPGDPFGSVALDLTTAS